MFLKGLTFRIYPHCMVNLMMVCSGSPCFKINPHLIVLGETRASACMEQGQEKGKLCMDVSEQLCPSCLFCFQEWSYVPL